MRNLLLGSLLLLTGCVGGGQRYSYPIDVYIRPHFDMDVKTKAPGAETGLDWTMIGAVALCVMAAVFIVRFISRRSVVRG